METITLQELRQLLKRQNRSDLARRHNLCRTSLEKVVSGERKPSRHLLKKLGLRPVTVYEIIPPEEKEQ